MVYHMGVGYILPSGIGRHFHELELLVIEVKVLYTLEWKQ